MTGSTSPCFVRVSGHDSVKSVMQHYHSRRDAATRRVLRLREGCGTWDPGRAAGPVVLRRTPSAAASFFRSSVVREHLEHPR